MVALTVTMTLGMLVCTTSQASCVLVFGQGRNYDPDRPDRNRYWDEINGRFNLAVREPLMAAGLEVVNVVLPVAATDVPGNLRQLLVEVKRLGCARVLETSLFADPAAGVVIARLRVYPVMGLNGPQAPGAHARIGAVAYTAQREFPLEVGERVEPERLGKGMAGETVGVMVPASVPAVAPTVER